MPTASWRKMPLRLGAADLSIGRQEQSRCGLREAGVECIANAIRCEAFVKSASIPPLRVTSDLRQDAESVLREGESLSSFVEEPLRRQIEHR